MRTTVTLDSDVERMIKDAMHRTRRSFKETLNEAVRAGLKSAQKPSEQPFVLKARELGLRPGYDLTGFNRLADELEVEAFMAKYNRQESS